MVNAFSWFWSTMTSFLTDCNFAITVAGYAFGFIDFLVAVTLLGIVVRNFVHSAK